MVAGTNLENVTVSSIPLARGKEKAPVGFSRGWESADGKKLTISIASLTIDRAVDDFVPN